MTGRAWQGGSTRAWRRLRQAVLERDGYTCQVRLPGICTGQGSHCDHITPKSKGGTDHPSNLRAACPPCNLARGNGLDPDPQHKTMTRW